MSSEIPGLQIIIDKAVKDGTLHILETPPDREAFPSDEAYSRAYRDWWDRMHLHTATIKNIGDGDAG